jgi:hypothetical protein
VRFEWREGFHPPSGVAAETVKAALDALPEPSPEALLEASKIAEHPLHGELWSEGDQLWAQRGRLEHCRRIIGAVHEVLTIGGKEITIRAVEFIRTESDKGRWIGLDGIRADPELLDAYFGEIQRLQDQAAGKMAKLRDLMRPA